MPTAIAEVMVNVALDDTVTAIFQLTGTMSHLVWALDVEARNWQMHRDVEAIARRLTQNPAIAIDYIDLDSAEWVQKDANNRITLKLKATGFLESIFS